MFKIRWLILYAVISFIAAVSVSTFYREIDRTKRLTNTLETKMQELVELSRTNQEMQEKVSWYDTPAGIAHLAREEFNLVKKGERIYQMQIVSSDLQK